MKQKLVIMLLTACMALSCTFAFAACSETPTADNGDDPVITPGDDDTPTTPDDDTDPDDGEQETPPLPPSEGLEFTLNGDGTASVTNIGSCTDTKLVIPSEHEGFPVTSIHSFVDYDTGFANMYVEKLEKITSVIIPDSVTRIGHWAFKNFSSLTEISIPDSVTSIEEGAFANCSSLATITIPDGITSIAALTFSICSSLSSITIPDGVTSIGSRAFQYCDNLASITIPDSVTSMGYSVFSYCSSLLNITVASGNSVYHSAGNCIIETDSKTLVLGCNNSVIPMDGSVTSIGSSAFYGCTNLTGIIIPDSVTHIGNSAFNSCSSLESITLPNSVIYIDSQVFDYCRNLTSVTFENTEGWLIDGWEGQISNIDVTDPAQNAVYFTDTYCWYTWTHGE